ncbi:MAG: hypothetical protein KF795_12320 [Labilithrix sp.]|nr:hypothetical protein [Labilithrix sp.]
MRRAALAIAVTLALALASPSSFAEVGVDTDAGAPPSAISAAPTESAPSEGLPLRLGKAAVFGVVVSALLLGGRAWRIRGKKGSRPPRR